MDEARDDQGADASEEYCEASDEDDSEDGEDGGEMDGGCLSASAGMLSAGGAGGVSGLLVVTDLSITTLAPCMTNLRWHFFSPPKTLSNVLSKSMMPVSFMGERAIA